MPQDSFTSALSRLDPASRALLDLSLRRGMRPEEIGELLGTEAASVEVAREAALEQLAHELALEDVSQLDDVRARLAELPPEAWTGKAAVPDARANGKPAAVSAPEPKRKAAPEPPRDREPRRTAAQPQRRRNRLPLLLAILAVAAVILVVALASGGSDDSGSTKQASKPSPAKKPSSSKPASKPSKPSGPKPGPEVQLRRIGGAGSGTARFTDGGRRLQIEADGLRQATYQVWLYDSIVDAQSLGAATGTKLQLDLKLPSNATHFKYVDVSREPSDGNTNHSGISVLRVPLAKLSR